MKPLWYLSGPMSNYPEHNFPAFTEACRILRDEYALTVISPHEIPHPEPDGTGSLPHDIYLRRDIVALLNCQGIVMLRGWPESKGACLELSVALQLGMWVSYFDGRLLREMSR